MVPQLGIMLLNVLDLLPDVTVRRQVPLPALVHRCPQLLQHTQALNCIEILLPVTVWNEILPALACCS